ncbi:hypothetical protein [Aeromonas caviae]|uniref:hypothetical protein n=1 Tax=Aeromonas caviae TaxID=648 RepID=UPI003F7493B4
MAVDFILKSPVMSEQTEAQRKIKNNIIAFSAVSIFIYHGRLSITPDSALFGLKFSGLTNDLIYLGLFTLIVYSCIHYSWYIYEDFLNYRLRLTAFSQLDYGDEDSICFVPQLDDAKNNTLYNWWVYKKGYIIDTLNINNSLLNSLSEIEVKHMNMSDGKINDEIWEAFNAARSASENASERIDSLISILNAPPFSDVIPNFHFSFKRFLISQNIRWIVFEILFPYGLALWSLIFISPIVYFYIFS